MWEQVRWQEVDEERDIPIGSRFYGRHSTTILLTLDKLRLLTNYAEHVDPKPPSVVFINLPGSFGLLRMSGVVFLRFTAPLLVSLRVDYSATMIS